MVDISYGCKKDFRLSRGEKMTPNNKFFPFLFRMILGLVFLFSGYFKLIDPVLFAESVYNYQVLGMGFSGWVAVFVPMFEVIVGISLIIGFWLFESLLITAALYILFDGMILQAMIRGLDISCGCFSPSESGPIDVFKIMQNMLLTLLAFGALYLSNRESAADLQKMTEKN
jgi:hypothetical protein